MNDGLLGWDQASDYGNAGTGVNGYAAQGRLTQEVNQLAPLANTYHVQQATQPVDFGAAATMPGGKSMGNLSKFAHFIGGIGTEVGHLAGGATTWLAHNTINLGEGIINAPKSVYNFGTGAIESLAQHHQVDQLTAQEQNLTKQYQSGFISSDQYKAELQRIVKQQNSLSEQIAATDQRLGTARTEAVSGLESIATIAAVVLTDGVGASLEEGATAKYLTSVNANAFLSSTEQALTKIAGDASLFERLEPAAQKAIQASVAEVVSSAGRASAAQIARASAVNLAIKYPIYYNYLSSTGGQIYKELDNKKYGDAIRTTAFNAALLLSGGPIGQALKYGGKAVGGVVSKTFSRTAFLDELSRGIGNGDPAGLFNAINKLPAGEKADVVKQMSAVEATNLGAVGGKDAVAAATRVLGGMENYEGLSMSQFTHDEALNNMVNFAKAQRMADETAKAHGLPPITVGRVDARTLDSVSANLTKASGKDEALQAWENLKQQSPNLAWANNENFDRQIKGLIDKHGDNPAELDAAIRRIKASFTVDKFPQAVADNLAKMGYIPIKPANLEAPFAEGTGKVATSFTKGADDFFVKSVQPLPILGSVGQMLTSLGLSPFASTQRVYQLFNDNLAKNLQESNVIPKIMGEDSADTTDTMIKRLSEYAHNPTRGKVISKAPITDLRMMTTGDIKAALGVSNSDALAIQKAISQAFVQVPMAVRGLGDKAVDILYNNGATGALQRRYLRVLGAARFSWNPFFQFMRLIPKTEILTSFEGGGFISSVFAGRGRQINIIRSALRDGGFLDTVGRGGLFGDVESGEAVDFAGSTGKNLNRRLLPMQEKSIAGLIDSQARRMGTDWKTYIKTQPQQVRDTIQMIAEYDKRSNLLNSPLMRTLNIAFFPLRFETKVAGIMARSLARTGLMTQVSVVNGLLRAHDFLNSREGQAWYSQNSQVIGLFEYITPVAELNQVFNALLPGHDHSLGNFGELGGIPFSFIPMLLDSEGITHFSQPYVDAKTGAIIPDYIPVTARGQLATAIQDFITSLFSYPGAKLGLESKGTITRTVAQGLVGANNKDFKKVTPTVSGQQKQFSDFIQSQQPTQPQPLDYPAGNAPAQPFSVPQQPTSATQPYVSPKTNARSGSTKTPKKKKAEYTPTLLPGQSQLGQL